ncbi:MAG: prephenate dehydratase [Oscillospiraceae bacterium]|jgi:chorismate mutase/prephenate dehydratase|nr:prephenate dehydratase [Oscillospiraceae bacterium]MCI9581473.1 prephenate dehydratase [Oscillospiraceae bacterium]
MSLEQMREEINQIDQELVDLFRRRMELSKSIGAYKQANQLPVQDPARERELLGRVAEQAGEELSEYAQSVYQTILAVSRSYQNAESTRRSGTYQQIQAMLEKTPELFPQRSSVACQGVEGAFSQLACQRLFKLPNIMFFQSFEHVFKAVESGMCQFGVLPIENSTAGSVNKIYDLMLEHNFFIVRSARLKVSHNLLVKPGVKLEDIREIYSHEQAINQCSDFLGTLKDVKITVCENTAVAAQMVSQSDRKDIAAISSRLCAEQYSLQRLKTSVQNQGSNYTRFICISKTPQIYPGADKTSIMMIVPHRPGSLSHILTKFSILGINLTKLESRPLPEREFEFMFYFDLEASVYAPEMERLFLDLESECETIRYLGSYSEIIG